MVVVIFPIDQSLHYTLPFKEPTKTMRTLLSLRDLHPRRDMMATYGDDGLVKVVVDPASAQLLEGATLDYKDGLDQSGFAITNPNASRTCGCGSSFS